MTSCFYLATTLLKLGFPLMAIVQPSIANRKRWYRKSQGKLSVCEGCTVWCYLIPSFFMGVDKYWWLNQVTYASEFPPEKILTTSLMRLLAVI